MHSKSLTRTEFLANFSVPMRSVTEEEKAVIDVWPYVEEVFARELPDEPIDNAIVNFVYLSGDEKYHHVGLWYGQPNTYLVLVIDLQDVSIYGHRVLDLGEEYGLSQPIM